MAGDDFSTWYGAGAYGGLLCALVAAAAIAVIALRGRRGEPRQVAAAVLACLAAACLTLPAIWWDLNRLEVYGPLLGRGEVMFWLTWTAAAGWVAPVAALAAFWSFAGVSAPIELAGPGGPAGARASPPPVRRTSDVPLSPEADPARFVEPLGPGRAWGQLVALDGPLAGRTSPLTRQLTLLGREADNDIVLTDDRTSRRHAEIRWDHGHVQLVDRYSLNGTLVNRQAVRNAMPLVSGDVIEIGDQRYRFELFERARVATPAAPSLGETQKTPGAQTMSQVFEGVPLMLIALNGQEAGERWLLRGGITEIGRNPDQGVYLRDSSVSREHALIVRQRSGYFVQDVGSSNNTLLNGQPLTAPAVLSAGDVLRVGAIELRCEAVPAPIPTAPPPPGRSAGRAAVTTPPATALPPGVFSNTGVPITRDSVRLGPPRLTPSDPPAPDQPPRQ